MPATQLDQLPLDMLESMPTGLLAVAPDLRIRYRNAAAANRLPEGDDLPTVFAEARFLDSFDGWQKEIDRLIHTGGRVRFGCALPLQPNGPPDLVILKCSPLRRAYCGGVAGVLIHIEDGAEWEGLQQRLLVAERLAAVGKLAAKVAHELNSPLDGILRYVNLAMRLVRQAEEPKLQTYLSESRSGLQRMEQIIAELLQFSRESQGEQEAVPINEVVEQALDTLTSAADLHGVVVAVDFQDQHMPAVRGTRLYQVCCNLIKNAIDAMPSGGRLMLTTGLVAGDVVIQVSDTGIGLPQPADRVFEPFFTTKQPGQGTGLGLAICKEFIEDMKGVLTAEANQPTGAVFTVRLPVDSCSAPGGAVAGPDQPPAGPKSEPAGDAP